MLRRFFLSLWPAFFSGCYLSTHPHAWAMGDECWSFGSVYDTAPGSALGSVHGD